MEHDTHSKSEKVEPYNPAVTRLFADIVTQEIVEVYDHLDSLLNRISVVRDAKVTHHLERAKYEVWEARMIAEGQA